MNRGRLRGNALNKNVEITAIATVLKLVATDRVR